MSRFKVPKLAGPQRLKLWFALAGVVSALLARPALAADVTGTWDLAFQLRAEGQMITLALVQDRQVVSGDGVIRGAPGGDPIEVSVRSGRVEGTDLYLVIGPADRSSVGSLALFGRWHRDEMSGRIEGPFGMRRFDARRRP